MPQSTHRTSVRSRFARYGRDRVPPQTGQIRLMNSGLRGREDFRVDDRSYTSVAATPDRAGVGQAGAGDCTPGEGDAGVPAPASALIGTTHPSRHTLTSAAV